MFLGEESHEYKVKRKKNSVRTGACVPQNEIKVSSFENDANRSVVPRRVMVAAEKAETAEGLVKERACG